MACQHGKAPYLYRKVDAILLLPPHAHWRPCLPPSPLPPSACTSISESYKTAVATVPTWLI